MLFLFDKYFKKKSKTRGFLLPEAILSLFVLSVGITSVIGLIAGSLRDSMQSRDIITATMLAQEGVELTRNIRDTGYLKDSLNPFFGCPTDSYTCFSQDMTKEFCTVVNGTSVEIRCSLSADTHDFQLSYFKEISHSHNPGFTPIKFYRMVYVHFLDSNPGSESAIVRSFVYWGVGESGMFRANEGTGGSTASCTVLKKCVYTEITLNNWRP